MSPETTARHRIPKNEAPLRASTLVHVVIVAGILAVAGLIALVNVATATVTAVASLVLYVVLFVGSRARAKRSAAKAKTN